MIKVEENIEMYVSVYNYMKEEIGINSITHINISKDSWSETYKASVEYIGISKGDFTYNIRLYYTLYLNDEIEWDVYFRESKLNILLNDSDEPSDIKDSLRVLYLRYKNSMKTFIDNKHDKMIRFLKKGDRVSVTPYGYDKNDNGVVDSIDIENNIVNVYLHSTKSVKPIKIYNIKLRKKVVIKDEKDLNQTLVSLPTPELLRLKNMSYGGWNSGYLYHEDFRLEDIKDVLNTREHFERKKKKRLNITK